VVLNACYSVEAGRIVALGNQFTIAMSDAISETGAIEFTRGFYDALGAGLDVGAAYKEGLSCAKLKNAPIAAVLLRDGEVFQGAPKASGQTQKTEAARDLILGVALDVSGSMSTSLQNREAAAMSRLEGARLAIARLASRSRDELAKRPQQHGSSLRVF